MHDEPSSDLTSLFRAVAAGHLLAYYREEGDFGALTPDHPDSIEPALDQFVGALERAVESFMAFEQGEPPGVFDLLARQIVGLPVTSRAAAQADAAEPSALVRDAARLEMRLEGLAADIMYAGLDTAPSPSLADLSLGERALQVRPSCEAGEDVEESRPPTEPPHHAERATGSD